MSLNVTRRSVLRNAVAGAVATVTAGESFAKKPGRKIVGLTADAGFEVASRRADAVRHELDFGEVGKAVAGTFSEEALAALRDSRQVRYVEDDGTVHALAQTLPWGIDRVDADVVHANGETGAGADIAIIDTGIDSDHPDLQANLGVGKAFVSCTGTNCNYAWDDDHDHGTHCAGIADAVDNTEGVVGVSTEATLHAVKVLDSAGSGTYSDIAAGIEWVADQGYDVGSLSLGGSSGSQTLKDAGQYATGNGVLLVAAAGNDGPCTDCVGYPAAYNEYMAVSSTDSSDDLSGFSSQGPEVEIAAPGTDIYSTVIGGYDTFSGTSMACPHVSGAGGQLMANGYTNSDARQRLKDTAEDIGLSDNEQGSGLLDVDASIFGCVDAEDWPAGTGSAGEEHITRVNMDDQVERTSGDDAYYDFTCPDTVKVVQGGSFTVELDFEDAGFDRHYADIYVDWDKNRDWSTASQTKIMQNVSDDTVTYTATVPVPVDAALGSTLARVRLSWDGFEPPTTTGWYGEVNDFTIEVV